MQTETIYFSSLLKTNSTYKPAADRLFAALDSHGVPYSFLENTRDIWARDYMPVRTKSGKYVSFRYDPSYLDKDPDSKTHFRQDIGSQFAFRNIVYSTINLDGGNVVFSPSRTKAIVSDRVFSENTAYAPAALMEELEHLLEAQIIIIPSLKTDFTGHADGMARFLDENTVLGNRSSYRFGLEQRIKTALRHHGIETLDFPCFDSPGDSAIGCYLNFLETDSTLFLPAFGGDTDREAVGAAESLFRKPVAPVNVNEIAVDGGVLNCISWEYGNR